MKLVFAILVSVAACMSLYMAPQTVAQENSKFWFLGAPEFKIEPTLSFEPLFQRPIIEKLNNDQVVSRQKQELESATELVLAMDIPSTIPRVGFTVEAILKPFEKIDNEPEIELETNFYLLESEQTGGWISSHFDIVDKFSLAERPGDKGAYTHKLNLEWDTAFLPFNRLSGNSHLKHIELEVSLDYVATGLPRAGDVIGNIRFVDDASRWFLSVLVVFPMAPL